MSLNNIKKLQSQRGFTLVELLIVIVIIAILAAITIVAYNGITNRAHSSAAKQAAQNVVAKAEAFNAENGYYPATFTDMNSGAPTSGDSSKSWYLPASSYDTTKAPGATGSQDNSLTIAVCPASATGNAVKGDTVTYYDYTNKTTATVTAGVCP